MRSSRDHSGENPLPVPDRLILAVLQLARPTSPSLSSFIPAAVVHILAFVLMSYTKRPGWESQLLETGFLAMFLVPWLSLSKFPEGCPAPLVCVWSYRWLLFRIMVRG